MSLNHANRHGCLFYVWRGLLGFLLIIVVLLLMGVVYQTVATEQDKRTFSPRGELYTVNGHQMHIVCKGEGSPTVVLQAGGNADSLWWHHVQNQLAEHTRVCAYDRPGHGWSEPTAEPRDALTIVSELHKLLQQAGVDAPYISVGHSYGAVWARIFAAQYPEDVVGLVLVDSTFLIPDMFVNETEFERWKSSNDALQAIPWVIYRTGLMRLASPGDFQRAGYPSEIVPEMTALRSPNVVFDTDYAEQILTRWEFTKADTDAQNLGDLPMIILWAGQSATAQDYFKSQREETAVYSSISEIRIIEGADHLSILGNEQYARQVSDAVLDVIEDAQTSADGL